MPESHHPSRHTAVPSPTPHLLERLLERLAVDTPDGRAELILVHGGAPLGDRRSSTDTSTETDTGTGDLRIEIRPLLGIDPVAELIGIRQPHGCRIVGVRASVTTRSADSSAERHGSMLHLLDADGTSVTQLIGHAPDQLRLGPDTVVRQGRLSDACRRILGLPTSPPPVDMVHFVIDAWLSIVLRTALISPGLRWPRVVELSLVHQLAAGPAPSESTNPAAMADALRDLAGSMDWHRYRAACVTLGGCPVSELSASDIAWMDTGMFSRWTHDSMPTTADLLDLLEPVLSPTAFDLLWATVALARHPAAPSCR